MAVRITMEWASTKSVNPHFGSPSSFSRFGRRVRAPGGTTMITATSRPILFVITLLAAPSVTRAGFMVGEGALEKPGGGMPVDVNILGVGPGYFTMDHNGTSDV